MPPACRTAGYALPLALTTSALLLLSSLSLQTLALHGRQRSRLRLHRAHRRDALQSAAMRFLQQARGPNACLLGMPSAQWLLQGSIHCPGSDPADLLGSFEVDQVLPLLSWQPISPTKGTLQLLWSVGDQMQIDLEHSR